MVKTEQTREAEHIFYLKQTYKSLCKEHRPACKDKDFVFGCLGCQANRFLRDFRAYIDWLEHLHKWAYRKK